MTDRKTLKNDLEHARAFRRSTLLDLRDNPDPDVARFAEAQMRLDDAAEAYLGEADDD